MMQIKSGRSNFMDKMMAIYMGRERLKKSRMFCVEKEILSAVSQSLINNSLYGAVLWASSIIALQDISQLGSTNEMA